MDPSLFLVPKEQLEYWICTVCTNVVRQPYDIPCGHLFCGVCLDEVTKTSSECPNCRGPIPKEISSNKAVYKLINSWKIKCPNKGCTWSDVIGMEERNYNEHAQKCDYAMVICTQCNHIACERQTLDAHKTNECSKRPVLCPICKDIIPFDEIVHHSENNDLNFCQNVIICPARCRPDDDNEKTNLFIVGSEKETGCSLIHIKQLDAHEKVCARKLESCPIVGCPARYPKNENHEHFSSNATLHTLFLQQQLDILQKQAAAPQTAETCFRWEFKNVSKIVQWNESSVFGFSNPVTKKRHALLLRLSRCSSHFGVYLFYNQGDLPFSCKFSLNVLGPDDQAVRTAYIHCTYLQHGHGQGRGQFIPIDDETLRHSNDSIVVGVFLIPTVASWIENSRKTLLLS